MLSCYVTLSVVMFHCCYYCVSLRLDFFASCYFLPSRRRVDSILLDLCLVKPEVLLDTRRNASSISFGKMKVLCGLGIEDMVDEDNGGMDDHPTIHGRE